MMAMAMAKGADAAKGMAESLTASQMFPHNLKLTSVPTSPRPITLLMCMPSSLLLSATNYTSTRNARRSKHLVAGHHLTPTQNAPNSPRWSPKWIASNVTSTAIPTLTDAASTLQMMTQAMMSLTTAVTLHLLTSHLPLRRLVAMTPGVEIALPDPDPRTLTMTMTRITWLVWRPCASCPGGPLTPLTLTLTLALTRLLT